MAVKHVQWQTHLSRTGNNSDGTSTAEEYFVIVCDADTTSDAVWGAAAEVTAPVYGTPHPTQGALYCNQTQYTPMDQNTRRIFQCRATYTDELIEDPLSQPAEIEWDFSEDGDQPYFLDCTGGSGGTLANSQPSTGTDTSKPKRVTNSAGELFEDFLTRATGSVTATYSINMVPTEAANMAQTLINYTKPVPSVNQGGFTFDGINVEDGQALIKGGTIGGIQKAKVGADYVYYRTVKYSLAFKASWDDIVDDRGYHQKYSGTDMNGRTGSTLLQEIMKGQPPIKPDRPWPLDGNGGAKQNITDTPASLTFHPYPKQSFGVFGFI